MTETTRADREAAIDIYQPAIGSYIRNWIEGRVPHPSLDAIAYRLALHRIAAVRAERERIESRWLRFAKNLYRPIIIADVTRIIRGEP